MVDVLNHGTIRHDDTRNKDNGKMAYKNPVGMMMLNFGEKQQIMHRMSDDCVRMQPNLHTTCNL